ncbi:MAG: SGNH/GDSL hydrolase family protein [Planctomycetes bacterium]|nr:SGNH/GDSL hydrolase family protein [Planctomycetota bacterium]
MTTVLCFGDSNTWGKVPNEERRYGVSERWPCLLRDLLPDTFELIEAGLRGRTTMHDDPVDADKNGLGYLQTCLESHVPDIVIILLGTNDLKQQFDLSPAHIAQGAAKLVETVFNFKSPIKKTAPIVLLLAPPPVYEIGFYADMFAGAAAKSQLLAQHYKACAEKLGCSFFDAGSVVTSSQTEGIHWDLDQHRKLAQALAEEIQLLGLDT